MDDKLRTLKLTNSRDQIGVFNTFSAHSVYMDEALNTLSSDYPGPFLDYIKEAAQLDFASFSPGATGSHTPANRNSSSRNSMLNYSSTLAGYFQALQTAIIVDTTKILKYLELPVNLRTPHFRVTNNIRFRPWVFNTVMGVNRGSITALRVGNTVAGRSAGGTVRGVLPFI